MASIVVSDRLTFLGKYRVTLLIECIPFLTAEQVLFSSTQTYELLECLQDLARDTSRINSICKVLLHGFDLSRVCGGGEGEGS